MEDDFFKRESNKLSFSEVMGRLSELEEDWDRNAPHTGVYRQLKDQGLETLTEKQRWIYENQLKPKSVEKCGYNRTCEKPAYPGKFCDMHELQDER